MKRVTTLALLATIACAGPPPAPTPAPQDVPPEAGPLGVILMIGDGTGLDYWSALKIYSDEPLAVEEFPVVGLVDTEATGTPITDSAAGATAFSAGVRTYYGAIGVGPDSVPVTTVVEVAERRGWATGLVATSRLTHATPGAFVAHVPSRYMYFEIARQMAESDVDVMLGAGTMYFDPAEREDGLDLLARFERRGAYVDSAEELESLDPDTVETLVGLFGEQDMPPAPTRSPSLSRMTDVALDVLEEDPDGFFLMVEGSQIDWRGHDNAPLPDVLVEVQDFDRAIRRALAFQQRRPNTLIVVLADHSTGGFSLAADSTGVLAVFYTTTGHTAGMVPMFAVGPGSSAFAGIMDNDRVGRLLLQFVRDGPADVRLRPARD